MFPIHTLVHRKDWEGRGGMSFVREVMAVCEDHRNQGRALLFAFLLFGSRDPEVMKVINDRDYWRALDHEAGEYLTVFVMTSPLSDPRSPRQRWNEFEQGAAVRALEVLKNHFRAPEEVQLPCLTLFQVKDGEVIDGFAARIVGESSDATYRCIKGHFTLVRDALLDLREENKKQDQEIFSLVRRRFDEAHQLNQLKRIAGPLRSLASVLKSIVMGH